MRYISLLLLVGCLGPSFGILAESNLESELKSSGMWLPDPNFQSSVQLQMVPHALGDFAPPAFQQGIPIRLLAHGEDSLAARLAAIRGAQKTIDIFTYIFEPCDASTKVLLDALLERAKKGVRIRLIVDKYELSHEDPSKPEKLAGFFQSQNAYLKAPIDFRLFIHPYLFGPNLIEKNYRAHNKMLLIDAQGDHPVYFIGGRNNKDGYFGLASDINYFDQDVMITGSTSVKVLNAFETVLKYATIRAPGTASDFTFPTTCLKKSPRDVRIAQSITAQSQDVLSRLPVYNCPIVHFDMDDPRYRAAYLGEPTGNFNDLPDDRLDYKISVKLVLAFFAGVKRSLHIANQYYVPVFRIADAISHLRERGKDIVVLTNSTADKDVEDSKRMTGLITDAIQRDSQRNQKVLPLSSLGALQDRGSLSDPKAQWRIHTKSAVADHRDVLISSFNLDSRSYQINSEDALMVEDCPDLAHAVEMEYQTLVNIWAQDLTCEQCKQEWKENLRMLPLYPPAGQDAVDQYF